MSDTMLAVLGGLAGLTWAVFGNVVVLPWVLKRQANAFERRPGLLGDRAQMASKTTFAYRVVMPILFTVVSAVLAVSWFGGG